MQLVINTYGSYLRSLTPTSTKTRIETGASLSGGLQKLTRNKFRYSKNSGMNKLLPFGRTPGV